MIPYSKLILENKFLTKQNEINKCISICDLQKIYNNTKILDECYKKCKQNIKK